MYKLPPDEFLGSPELEVSWRSLLPCPTLKGLVHRKGDSEKQMAHGGAVRAPSLWDFSSRSSHLSNVNSNSFQHITSSHFGKVLEQLLSRRGDIRRRHAEEPHSPFKLCSPDAAPPIYIPKLTTMVPQPLHTGGNISATVCRVHGPTA